MGQPDPPAGHTLLVRAQVIVEPASAEVIAGDLIQDGIQGLADRFWHIVAKDLE